MALAIPMPSNDDISWEKLKMQSRISPTRIAVDAGTAMKLVRRNRLGN
jgi:hypothetical protein